MHSFSLSSQMAKGRLSTAIADARVLVIYGADSNKPIPQCQGKTAAGKSDPRLAREAQRYSALEVSRAAQKIGLSY